MPNCGMVAPEAHPLGVTPGGRTLPHPQLWINQLAASQVVTPSAILARLPMPESHSP